MGQLVRPEDLGFHTLGQPIRVEIDLLLQGLLYQYAIALELPEGFREFRILEERLTGLGSLVYERTHSSIKLFRQGPDGPFANEFRIDWHLAALPLIQERDSTDPVAQFKKSLAKLLILRPQVPLMQGESHGETLQPSPDLSDFAAWFTGIFAYAPRAYSAMMDYLQQSMPDLEEIRNVPVGRDAKSLEIQFRANGASLSVPFASLSDGEKIHLTAALLIAANRAHGPVICFWDEPDAHVSLAELCSLSLKLRKSMEHGGQLIVTSHHPELIRKFSRENTILLQRQSHLDPTRVFYQDSFRENSDVTLGLITDDLVA